MYLFCQCDQLHDTLFSGTVRVCMVTRSAQQQSIYKKPKHCLQLNSQLFFHSLQFQFSVVIKMEEGSLITSSLLLRSGESIRFDSFHEISEEESLSKVIFSSLVAVCGSYVYGHAVGYSSPAESGIIQDLGLTTAQYSVFSSILTIGAMLGAILSGRVADFIGRRIAMGISEIFCISGWLAIAFAQDSVILDLGRFVLGFGIGLLSYAIPIYIAEITPKNVRGTFTAMNPLLMGFGQSFGYLIGSLVNWRVLALIGAIPGVIQLPCLFFIPESPRWLAKVGRTKEFEASLQSLRGKNADISKEATEIRDYTNYLQSISGSGFLTLFQWKYAYTLTVGVGLIVFQRLGGLYGFLFYASTIFEAAGFPSRIGSILAAVVQIITTALGLILIDRAGRRPMLLISSVGACLGCIITGLAFLFQDFNYGTVLPAVLVCIGVLMYLGLLQLGLGGVPWIIMSEIFPINIKGSAGSLVILVSWIGSWLVSYTYNSLFEWSSAGTFFLYAAICGMGVIFIAKLVPETKGRALEEIQASMILS